MADDEFSSSEPDGHPQRNESAVLRLDTVFELLANRRRRYTIYSLMGTPSGVTAFDDLVAAVSCLESDEQSESVSEDLRERIAADLHYWHLPVLEEVGVISYDDMSEVVQFDGSPTLERWAERVRADELSGCP